MSALIIGALIMAKLCEMSKQPALQWIWTVFAIAAVVAYAVMVL